MQHTDLQTDVIPRLFKYGSFDASMSATVATFVAMGITDKLGLCSRVETTSTFYVNGIPYISCYALDDEDSSAILKRYLWELSPDFSEARFVHPGKEGVERHHLYEDDVHPRADEISFSLPCIPGVVFVKRDRR